MKREIAYACKVCGDQFPDIKTHNWHLTTKHTQQEFEEKLLDFHEKVAKAEGEPFDRETFDLSKVLFPRWPE